MGGWRRGNDICPVLLQSSPPNVRTLIPPTDFGAYPSTYGGTLILDVGLCCCGPKVVPSWSPLGFLAIPQWAPVVPKWTLRGPYVVPQRSLSGPFAAPLWTNLGSLMGLNFPP